VRRRRPQLGGAGLALVTLAGTLLWTAVVRPAEARTRSEVHFAAQVRDLIKDSPVYVPFFDPEFSWYFGRAVPPLPRTSLATLAASPPIYLVARPTDVRRMAPAVRMRLEPVLKSNLQGNPPTLYLINKSTVQVDSSSRDSH
jgi:hypothetical protein